MTYSSIKFSTPNFGGEVREYIDINICLVAKCEDYSMQIARVNVLSVIAIPTVVNYA
jgi:hypothetical protein